MSSTSDRSIPVAIPSVSGQVFRVLHEDEVVGFLVQSQSLLCQVKSSEDAIEAPPGNYTVKSQSLLCQVKSSEVVKVRAELLGQQSRNPFCVRSSLPSRRDLPL